MVEANKEEFADPKGVIQAHIMLAPHQSWAIDVKRSNAATVAVTHWGDILSDDDVSGDAVTIETKGISLSGIFQRGHSVSSFENEAVKIAGQLTDNSQTGAAKYDGINGLLEDQKDYNAPTD